MFGKSFLVAKAASPLWHRRLGHLGHEALSKLASSVSTHLEDCSDLCHAYQLGRHVRLPFHASVSRASNKFDLIHCDLWTSPVVSISGYKYYLVILDDCTHYLWTFPLRVKSDTFSTLATFIAYVSTQFSAAVKAIQCDNGCELDNSSARTFLLSQGIHLRMSCPYISHQNGKAERIIRSINNVVRSLLFQAPMPPSYWVEALSTAIGLLNILPTKTLAFSTPHLALHGTPPVYDHLWVFGCKCYPNLSATAPHKLAPRSALCVFLGYSDHHKGYRCLDLSSNRIIISRHAIFDEAAFPFADRDGPRSPVVFEFLNTPDTVPDPIGPQHKVLPTGILPGDPGSSTATTGTSALAPKDPVVPPLVPAPAASSRLDCISPVLRAAQMSPGAATRGPPPLLTSPGSGTCHHQRLHAPGTRGLCSGATRTVSSACAPVTTSNAASQGCCCYLASDQPALDGDSR
jgi:hypothetical protein